MKCFVDRCVLIIVDQVTILRKHINNQNFAAEKIFNVIEKIFNVILINNKLARGQKVKQKKSSCENFKETIKEN